MVTINKEISQSIEAVNEMIAHETKVQKQERRAQIHRASVGKDVIAPATVDEKATAPKSVTQPKLPVPKEGGSQGNPFGDDSPGKSIQAIIGAVLILQAKDQSQFWSITWKLASEAQETFIKFAPIIAAQTKANWDAQAASTRADAGKAMGDGIADAFAAGAGLVMGFVMTPADEIEGAAKEGASAMSNMTKGAAADAQALEENGKGLSTLQKFGNAFKGAFQNANFSKKMMASMQAAQGAGMIGSASKGMFVDNPALSKMAECQEQAGQADSVAKECEQFSQYWTQLFSRQEDLRGAAQQNLDYGMNIFKSISDTSTQTIISMFRG